MPLSIVSDKGSQLIAAGNIIASEDLPCNKYNWDKIVSSNSSSKWEFVPAKAQHRNGLAESTVKVMKKSLALALGPGVELTYCEMVTLLAQIACSVNSRPLGLQNMSDSSQIDDVLTPLTPNQLLIGRSTSEPPLMEFDRNDRFTARQEYVEQLHQAWWARWTKEVFPTLVPCKRWREIRRNLKKHDIVMMMYPGQIKDDYRIARVLEVYPDAKGLVRTVKVAYRRRDKREPKEVYWKKPLVNEVVAVQRLSLLQAAGEKMPTGTEEDNLPVDVGKRISEIGAGFVSLVALRNMVLFS